VPLTILVGAGKIVYIGTQVSRYGIIGAAAGSLFVFKGICKAVLINYPSREEKHLLIKQNFIIN
jgi:cyclase